MTPKTTMAMAGASLCILSAPLVLAQETIRETSEAAARERQACNAQSLPDVSMQARYVEGNMINRLEENRYMQYFRQIHVDHRRYYTTPEDNDRVRLDGRPFGENTASMRIARLCLLLDVSRLPLAASISYRCRRVEGVRSTAVLGISGWFPIRSWSIPAVVVRSFATVGSILRSLPGMSCNGNNCTQRAQGTLHFYVGATSSRASLSCDRLQNMLPGVQLSASESQWPPECRAPGQLDHDGAVCVERSSPGFVMRSRDRGRTVINICSDTLVAVAGSAVSSANSDVSAPLQMTRTANEMLAILRRGSVATALKWALPSGIAEIHTLSRPCEPMIFSGAEQLQRFVVLVREEPP